MTKNLFIILLSVTLLLFGCSKTNQLDDVSSIKNSSDSLNYKLDKNEFINNLSEKFKLFDSLSIMHVADIPEEESDTATSTYIINNDLYIDDLLIDSSNCHLSVNYYNDNTIESINVFANKEETAISFDYPFVYCIITTLVNEDDFDWVTFSKKYKLDSYEDVFENDVSGEEEKFKIFKSINGEYVSVNITMK